MKDKLPTSIKDVTVLWKKQAKPKKGIILVSDYTIGKDGNRYDLTNAKLGIVIDEEIRIGTWFKNTIWGDVVLQRGVSYPNNVSSADLLMIRSCPFLNEQTIEIKTLNGTKRRDGVTKRLKRGKEQSTNVLLDTSKTLLDYSLVIKEAINYFSKHNWLDILIIVNKGNYIVFKK